MDVKAVNQIQAASEMHASSMETHQQAVKKTQKEDNTKNQEFEAYQKLSNEKKERILDETAKKLNEKFALFNNTLKIEIDKDTGIQVVKIIDSKTKKVIRQLPPEVMLKIAKYIDEITGLLFDKKV